MSNPFEKYFQATERQQSKLDKVLSTPSASLFQGYEPPDYTTPTEKSGGDILNDVAIATAKTIVGVPQALVGLADIAGYGFESALSDTPVEYTGYLGKALEDSGIRFKDAQDIISTGYSDAYKSQQTGLHNKGEFNLDNGLFSQNNADVLAAKAAYVADNPALAVNTTLESLGYMLAGGAIGTAAKAGAASLAARAAAGTATRGTVGVADTTAGILANAARTPTGAALAAAEKGIMNSVGKRVALGALGEGAISAGILQENIRNQTEDGLTSPEQTNLAAVGGAGVGLLGYGFGRLANRAGAADIDTALIRSSAPTTVAGYLKNNPVTRVGKGALIEGLEEVPQENLENFVENLATDKGEGNILYGAADSTVLGFGAGALMGGAINLPTGLSDAGKDIKSGLGKVKDAANLKSFDTLSNPEHKNYNPAQAFNLQLKNLESNDETVRTQAEASVSKIETDLNTARASVEKRIKSIQATLKAIPTSDQTTDAQKLEIEALGKEYSALTTKSSTLADQYVAFLEAQVTAQENRDAKKGTQFTEEQAKADIATLTSVEGVDPNAQQEALDRVTRHFSKYSNDDLDLLATSPILSEAQRNSLRLMSESKRQLAAVQDPSQVFDNILNGYKGKTIRESHRGLNQYTDMVNTAVATKNAQLASLALDGLGAFTDDHTAKRDVINEAFGLVQKGTYKEVQVVRTQEGTWGLVPFTAQEVKAGKNTAGANYLSKEALNKVGGLNIHSNSDKPVGGRAVGTITQINNETQLIQDRFNALSGVAESFVGAAPKPVDTSTAPTVDEPIVTEPSDTTAPVDSPAPEAPVQSADLLTVDTAPQSIIDALETYIRDKWKRNGLAAVSTAIANDVLKTYEVEIAKGIKEGRTVGTWGKLDDAAGKAAFELFKAIIEHKGYSVGKVTEVNDAFAIKIAKAPATPPAPTTPATPTETKAPVEAVTPPIIPAPSQDTPIPSKASEQGWVEYFTKQAKNDPSIIKLVQAINKLRGLVKMVEHLKVLEDYVDKSITLREMKDYLDKHPELKGVFDELKGKNQNKLVYAVIGDITEARDVFEREMGKLVSLVDLTYKLAAFEKGQQYLIATNYADLNDVVSPSTYVLSDKRGIGYLAKNKVIANAKDNMGKLLTPTELAFFNRIDGIPVGELSKEDFETVRALIQNRLNANFNQYEVVNYHRDKAKVVSDNVHQLIVDSLPREGFTLETFTPEQVINGAVPESFNWGSKKQVPTPSQDTPVVTQDAKQAAVETKAEPEAKTADDSQVLTELNLSAQEIQNVTFDLKNNVSLGTVNTNTSRQTAQLGSDYTYSGKTYIGQPIPTHIKAWMDAVNKALGTAYNSVLVQYYPANTKSGIGFHKDNEKEQFDINQPVVSLSIGQTIPFVVHEKLNTPVTFNLKSGDVFKFDGNKLHGIASQNRTGERYSLTLRQFHKTKTTEATPPVATIDGEQTGRGTSEATQSAETSTESQVEPVATEDAKVTVLQGVTDEVAAAERKKPFNLRNILKGYFIQVTTKENAIGANPLVTMKDFLKHLGTLTQVSDWLNGRRKPTEKQLAQVEHFKKFHAEFAKALKFVFNTQASAIFVSNRENLVGYMEMGKKASTRELDENVVTALALSAYSYLIKQGNKVMNTNEELETLFRLKKGVRAPLEIEQMFRFAGQEMPIVIKALGTDTAKALGLKVREDQDPTLQDRLNTSLGILAMETMAKAGFIVIETLQDHPTDEKNKPLTDFLTTIKAVRESKAHTIEDEYDFEVDTDAETQIKKFTMVRPNAKMEGIGNSVFEKGIIETEVDGKIVRTETLTLNRPVLTEGLPTLNSALVNELIEANKDTKGFLSYLFGVDVGLTTPLKEIPKKFSQKLINGTDASVPSAQAELLTEAQKHSFTMRTNTVAVLARLKEMDANSQFLKEVLGIWIDDHVLSRTHVTERDSLQAKAQNDWTALLNGLEWADDTLDEQGEYQEFYDTQFVAQNQRQHLNSNMFSAQSSQIHRAMAALTGFSTTIDLSQDGRGTIKDEALLNLFYQAVGEGLEGLDDYLKADILSKAKAGLHQFFTVDKVYGDYYVPALKAFLETTESKAAVSAMVDLIQGKTITDVKQKAIAAFVDKGKMGVQSLQSLIALGELAIAQANGTTFTTTIGFGSDGVNHGVSAANVLTGVISKDMRQQTGIFPIAEKGEDQIDNMQEVYRRKITDYYVDFGKVMAAKLRDLIPTFVGKLNTDFVEGMQALFPKFEALDDTGELKNLLAMRKMAKIWAIPFNYSAGKAALQRALARGFLAGIYVEMNKLANKALDIIDAQNEEGITAEQLAALDLKLATVQEQTDTLQDNLNKVLSKYGMSVKLPAPQLLNEEDKGKLSSDLENTLMQAAIDLHGKAAWQATEEFAEKYLQVRNVYTEVEKASFTLFDVVRSQLIEEKKANRKFTNTAAKVQVKGKTVQYTAEELNAQEAEYFGLTTAEMAEIDAELTAMRPMFNTALSIGSESTNDAGSVANPSGVSVRKHKMQREPAKGLRAVNTFYLKEIDANGKPFSESRNIGLTKEVEENAGVASSANAIQSVDAFVAAKIQGFMVALNAHDNAIFGLKDFLKGVKKQNEEHLKALTNYQLGLEHAKMLVKVYQGYKAFMATQEEALKTAEGKVKENIQRIINEANKEMGKLLKGEVLQREGKNLVIGGEVISKGGLIPKLKAAGIVIDANATIEQAIGMFIEYAINQDAKKLGILKDTFGIHQFAGEGGMHQLTDENKASIDEQKALVNKAKEDLQAELEDKTVEQVTEVTKPTKPTSTPQTPSNVNDGSPKSDLILFLEEETAANAANTDPLFKTEWISGQQLVDFLKRVPEKQTKEWLQEQEVLKAIEPLLPKFIKVFYQDFAEEGYGYYDEATNSIYIKPHGLKGSKVDSHLIIHELLHSATSLRIKALNASIATKTAEATKTGKPATFTPAEAALNKLDDLRQEVLSKVKGMPILNEMLKSVDEFISYGLTDQRLQHLLGAVPVERGGRTAPKVNSKWRTFVLAVMKATGFKSGGTFTALSAFAMDTAALLETIGSVTPVVAPNNGERLFSTQSAEDRVNTKPEINTALEQARKAVRELLTQLNFKFVGSPDVNLSDIERIASKYLTEGESNNDPAFLKDAAISLSYAIYFELGLPQGNAKMREWLEQSLLDWLTTGEIPKLHKSVWVKAVEIFNKLMAAFSGKEFKAIESRLEATLNKIINREDFSFKPKQGYAKLVFQKEMTNNPLAVQSLLTFIKSGIKFALTGSVAYADQVPLYRQENKPLHDMDFLVAPEDLQDAYDYFTQKDPDNWGGAFTLYDVVKEGKRILGFAVVPKGFVIKNGKSGWNREQKAPERSYDVFNVVTGLKAGSYYFLGGKEEVFTGVAGITIDLLAEDARDTVTQTFKDTTGTNKSIEVSTYVGGFTAKLDMLRLKDINDFIGVVPPTERILSKPKTVEPVVTVEKPAPVITTAQKHKEEAAALEEDALNAALNELRDKQRMGDKSPLLKMKFKAYNDEMNKRGAAVSNKGERRYSKNTLSGNGLTVASTRQILVKQFGEKLIKVLEAKGLLRIVETMAETPEAALESNTEGYYLNGKATLVADGLTPETVVATLLHELSGHKGFQELMEPAAYTALMKQFDKLVAEGNPIALAALKRAQEATGSDGKPLSLQGQMDEYLPYLLTIQAAINATQAQKSAIAKFIDNVFRAVRAWAYKKLQANGYEGAASTFMQPQDIVYMAERMLREMANNPVTSSNTQSPIKFSTQSAEDLVNGQSSLDIMTALPHSNTGAFNQQLDRLIVEEIGQLYNQDDAAKARIDEIQTFTASDALNAGFILSRKEQYVQQALQYAVAAYRKLHGGGANEGQLNRVYHAAKAKIDPTGKDFHEGDWATATQQEQDSAKAKYDFLFDSTKEGYMDRFVSMALASESVSKILDIALPLTKPETQDKTWFEKVSDWVAYVMAWLTNKYVRLNPTAGASNQLVQLMGNLVSLDIRARQEGVAFHQKAWNSIGLVTTPLNNFIKKGQDAALKGDGLSKSRFLPVRALGAAIVLRSEEAAKVIPQLILDMRNNQLPHTKLGEAANILMEAASAGSMRNAFDVLTRQTNLNAKNRQDIVDNVKKAVNGWFKTPLTKMQHKAITYVLLRTDTQALLEDYSVEDIVNMALHEGKLNAEIAKLKKEIVKNPNGNDMLNAAEQLGYYMVTRIGGEGLVKNATGIAIGLGTQYFTSVEQADAKLVHQLDVLASMMAMSYTSNSDKAIVAALYKTDKDGVHATINLHNGLVAQATGLFQDNPLNKVKGWMPEITNPYREIKTAESMIEREQMEAEGWVFVAEVKRDKHDKGNPKYLMKHNDIGYQRFVSGAVDLLNPSRSGTEAIDRTNPKYLGITQARYQNAARRASIPNSSFDPSKQPRGLITAYDTNGVPLAYTYEMDNETRDDVLDRNHNIGDLLGTFGGKNYYTPVKTKQNSAVAQVLFEDYRDNYSQNPNAYIKLSPKSTDPKVVEMWRMLPQDFKDQATALYGKGNPIVIRNEAFNFAFGFKKFSLVSNAFDAVKAERERIAKGLIGIGKAPNAFQSGFVRFAEATRKGTAQADFAKAEHVVQEIVKAIKDFIVIRSGTTMFWNIFANVLMLMANGINPFTIVQDWVFAVTNVRAYQKLNSQLIQAQADLVAGKDPVALKQKIGALKAELKANKMNPYINAGLLSSIVEDVNIQTGDYTYNSAFKQTVDEKTQWVPKPVKTAAKVLTIAPSTKLYQFLATTTQLSDFVAKYSMSKHLQANGMAMDESVVEASKTFINYDLPTSQGLQYANDMGLFMFTKFFLRIQAVLMKLMGKKAGSVIAQHILVESLTGAEGILSPSLFNHIGNNPLESSVFGLPSAFFSIGTVDAVTGAGGAF